MFKKTMTYYDLNGKEQVEDLYFNLTTIELARLAEKTTGGADLEAYITEAINSNDNVRIINTLADLVIAAYGKKSEDGLRFIKNSQIKEDFENSIVFGEFLEELITDENLALEFTSNVVDSKVLKKAVTEQPKLNVVPLETPKLSYTVEEVQALLNAQKGE